MVQIITSCSFRTRPRQRQRRWMQSYEEMRKHSHVGLTKLYTTTDTVLKPAFKPRGLQTMARDRTRPTRIEVHHHALRSMSGRGIISLTSIHVVSGIDAGIKFRPSHREVEEIGPEFKSRWDQHFANAPDRPAFILAPDSLYVLLVIIFGSVWVHLIYTFDRFLGDPALVPPGKYYCMEFFTVLYPMFSLATHHNIVLCTDF